MADLRKKTGGRSGLNAVSRSLLEGLYEKYNRRRYVHPDPLEFLYRYEDVGDREIAGLMASVLAYGRVGQILKSVARVLDPMGPSPRRFVERSTPGSLRREYGGFKHRFTTGEEMADLLGSLREILREHGSLEACFLAGCRLDHSNVLKGLEAFAGRLNAPCSRSRRSILVPSPGKGSACKRLNLFLRWMVRRDRVDPGGWTAVSPRQLVVPLDVHLHRISRLLGLTRRRSADLKAALEITQAFRSVAPDDPVRYDFALTRFGIREDMDMAMLREARLEAEAAADKLGALAAEALADHRAGEARDG